MLLINSQLDYGFLIPYKPPNVSHQSDKAWVWPLLESVDHNADRDVIAFSLHSHGTTIESSFPGGRVMPRYVVVALARPKVTCPDAIDRSCRIFRSFRL